MREQDARELSESISQDFGPDSARPRRLGNGEWVTDLIGFRASDSMRRACIYRLWSWQDWINVSPQRRAKLRHRLVSHV